jgi:adenylate kinase
MLKDFIIFGPPGSGKGTQAKRLVKRFGFKYVGTGDLMRRELSEDSDLGRKIKRIVESGGLVDDETANQLVDRALSDISVSEIRIFDGYPRTLGQAKHLQDYFDEKKIRPYVLNLNVVLKNLIDRTSTRRVCESCKKIFQNPEELKIQACTECGGNLVTREDDRPEVVKNRLGVYNEQTKSLLDYYREHGILIEIDGNPPIDEVGDEIEQKVEDILAKND